MTAGEDWKEPGDRAALIRAARRKAGKRQADVAAMADIGLRTYQRYESGRRAMPWAVFFVLKRRLRRWM